MRSTRTRSERLTRFRARAGGVIAGCLLALPTIARAQDDPWLLGTDEDDAAFSAATRGLERPQDAPGFLVVVYERDIAERGYRTLADLLDDVPGFWLERDERGPVVFTRGLAQSILVVYDGVPLILDTGRSELPVGDEISLIGVRSVEVLRGTGTALWGPNAFNGIVYIRTKDAVDVAAPRLIADVGSTERAGLGAEGVILRSPLSIYATARFLRDRGHARLYRNAPLQYTFLGNGVGVPIAFADGGKDERAASLYAEALVKARWHRAHLEIRYADSIVQGVLSSHSHSVLESDRNERRRAPTLVVQGGNRWRWGPNFSARTDVFFLARQRHDRLPLYRVDPNSQHRHGGRITVRAGEAHAGISAQADYRISAHTLTAGIQASYNDSTLVTDFVDPVTGTFSQSAFGRQLNNGVVSVYAQDRIAIGPARLTLGTSYDDQTDFAPSLNPRVGLVVPLGRGVILKTLYAEGIRTPDLFDVVGISGGAAAGDVVGITENPNLASEKIRTGELGAEYRRGTIAWGSANVYASSVEGLIEQEANAGVLQAVNGPQRFAAGFELAGQVEPTPGLRFHGSYTLSRLLDLDGAPLPAGPLHNGNAGASWEALDWLTLYGAVHASSTRSTAGADFGDGDFGPYFLLDARAIIQPRRWPLTLSLGVENLLDAAYDNRNAAIPGRSAPVPIPGDPRAFYLTVEGRF